MVSAVSFQVNDNVTADAGFATRQCDADPPLFDPPALHHHAKIRYRSPKPDNLHKVCKSKTVIQQRRKLQKQERMDRRVPVQQKPLIHLIPLIKGI